MGQTFSVLQACDDAGEARQEMKTDEASRVTQQLQVTACVLRKAVRSAAKDLASLLQV